MSLWKLGLHSKALSQKNTKKKVGSEVRVLL
jgi:hypothetical protein